MKFISIALFVALFVSSAADEYGTTHAHDATAVLTDQPRRRGAADQDFERRLLVPPCISCLYPPNTVTPGSTVNAPNLGKFLGLDRREYPSVAEFRGIPYAEPPLRWQPPKMHKGTGGDTFNATDYGNICFQNVAAGSLESKDDVQSEDCLLLHIGTPKSALQSGAKKLPVMIWIHGGGFEIGKGSEFDTAPLVAASGGKVVVVLINYRLGVFGYLGGDELMSHTNGAGAGNFGTQDQRMAMQWVKENIGAFGGDADEVTLFGQSAGAMSILSHLVQPESFPLYKNVIIESGSQNLFNNTIVTIEDANRKYKIFLNDTGCEDMDCLLKVDARSLLANTAYLSWAPVIDGVSLTDNFVALFEAKLFNNKVPIIIGSNREEPGGTMEIPSNNLTEAEFDSLVPYSSMEPEELAELKQLYNPKVYSYPAELGEYSIWAWMFARTQTDMMVTGQNGLPGHCSDRWLARKLLDGGSKSIYNYRWAHTPNSVNEVFAVHGAEPFYAFDMMLYPVWKAQQTGDYTWKDVATADDKKMGHVMSSYWSSFAISGDPNPTGDASELGMVEWPKFTTEAELTIMLEDDSKGGIRIQQNLIKEQCDWHLQYAQSLGLYLPPKSETTTSSATKPAPTPVSIGDKSMSLLLLTLSIQWTSLQVARRA